MTNTDTTTSPRPQSAENYSKILRVNAAADTLYNALTTASGLSNWWAPCEGDGQEGGEIRFRMNAPQPLVMRVTRATRARIVEWTVTDCPFLTDWVGTRPTFTLTPVGPSESELHFVHHGLTSELECIDMCTHGWNRYLVSLAEYAVTGQGYPVGSAADKSRHQAETQG